MKNIVLKILMLIVLFGCQARRPVTDEDLLLKDSDTLEPPPTLSANETQEDLDVLLYAFQNGYGGRKFIPADGFQKAIRQLSTIQQNRNRKDKVQTQDLCKKIADVLFELPDNHLSARINGKDCSQAHDQLYNDGHVGQNSGKGADKNWSVIYKQISRQEVPVLSMTSMPQGEDKAWDGFLDAVRKIKETALALIIDLRLHHSASENGPPSLRGRFSCSD